MVGFFSTLASGPLQSWNTLEPILMQMGVFEGAGQQGQLTEVFSIAVGFAAGGSCVGGLIYDRIGPKLTATFTAAVASVLLLMLCASVSIRSLNWTIYVVYPLLTLVGNCNTFGMTAWLWLLPGSQNTVAAMMVSVTALSDSLVLLLVWAHDSYGVPLSVSFATMAALSLLTALVEFLLVPSKEENLKLAALVIEEKFKRQEAAGASYMYAAMDAEEAAEFEGRGDQACCCEAECAAVRNVSTIALRLYPTANVLHTVFLILLYMCTVWPSLVMYEYYVALVGEPRATQLVNLYAGLYGIGGALAAFLFGIVMDHVSFATAVGITTGLGGLMSLMAVDASWAFVAAQCILVISINVGIIIVQRFAMLYAPELFGTY